ncbi:MAG: ATP-binding protein [Eubacteriales bacterium]
MKSKLFKYIFLATMSVFILCLSLILGAVYNYFAQRRIQEIKTEAGYLASAVESCGVDFMTRFEDDKTTRITLVAADGTVLFDNVADPAAMGNHGDREEIIEALESGEGESTRTSSTLSEKTVNYAKRLSDGSVLRVSVTHYTILTLLANMFTPILLILVVAILLSLFLAFRLAGSVTEPINRIDLETPDERTVYEELRPLVRRINSQNRQIHAQIDQIRAEHNRQDDMRREFTANVSHELKTPLTSISGFAEIIRDGMVRPEDIPRFAANIYDEAGRLIVLVGDILKLSKLEDPESVVPFTSVELISVCQRVTERLRPIADKHHIVLIVRGKPTTVSGSPQILEEIIYNLCDNAVKYNVEHGTVTVSVEEKENGVSLCVADTGIGIPKEDQERVFERFYRVDKSHSKDVGGTGLGLSIVKHGAILHHATVQLTSVVGSGTIITLLFPKEKGTSPEASNEVPPVK